MKCITCGKEYKYCPSCVIDPDAAVWMMNYCGENCRDIGKVIHNHYHGKITAAAAIEKLQARGVYESGQFTDDVLNYISRNLMPAVQEEYELPEEAEDEPEAEDAEG